VSRPQQTTLERDDVVAVRLPPGTEWLDIVAETWEAGAALFPLDHRLPEPMAAELLHRARPTVIRDADGTNRLDGEPADEDDALILHTSGTSDGPKLVRLSRPAVRAAVSSSSDALGATSEDAWLGCLPVAHVGGLLVVRYIDTVAGWISAITGRPVFDPKIYLFPSIPTAVDYAEVTHYAVAALVCTLIASAVPAIRAGLLNPAEALHRD